MGRNRLPGWTHTPLYLALRTAMSLPLAAGCPASMAAARVAGRSFAQAGFNRKRLDRAAANIQQALPALSSDAGLDMAIKGYEHLFELAAEICFAPRLLNEDGWTRHVELIDVVPTLRHLLQDRPMLLLTGHAGNWEILGLTFTLLGFPLNALYRPLDMKPLDRWVRQTRSRRGLTLLDKFGAAQQVPSLLEQGEKIGIVADQNAGDRGLFVPFLGRLTSSYKMIGIMAIRHRAVVMVGGARRIRPGDPEATRITPGLQPLDHSKTDGLHYRLEVRDLIQPEEWESQPDPLFYLTARYRRAIEQMVLECPEQYLWMHRIWKSRPRHEVNAKPFPEPLREKLLALPWMSSDDVERIVDRSQRDTAWLTEHETDRLP